MPHIILRGIADLAGLHENFSPVRADSFGWIIKLSDCHLSYSRTMLLFECTAVRSGFSQDFYIRAEQKGETVTVRVDPYMRIERNEGVQRTLLAVTKLLKQKAGNLSFERTNLALPVQSELES